jgi:hypothetical protein
VKKKISIVLAIVLTLTLSLTGVVFAAVGHWNFVWDNSWGGTVSNWLEMYCYSEEDHCCGPSSGVSIGQYYREVIDRDGNGAVSEDFEWGSDGTSLGIEPPLGDIDWTVEKSWLGVNPLAEIDTEQKHSGSKSARFYNDSGYMLASYSHALPTYKKFWLKKDADSVPCMITGDGNHRIWVRVNSDNQVEYYDGSWEYACSLYGGFEWHCIELTNIDWVHATYDIFVDYGGKQEVPMQASITYEGKTVYYNGCGLDGMGSEFWIDDILDTRGDYPALPHVDEMYDALHEYMDTQWSGYTSPDNYGPGFVEMALHYGYDNFSYVYDGSVTADDYGVVVDAIDNGWPVALFAMGMLQGFRGVEALPGSDDGGKWPCEVWHVIAIKGYSYYSMFGPHQYWPLTRDHRIRCTDNYSGANNLTLDWDELVDEIGGNLRMVIIKD